MNINNEEVKKDNIMEFFYNKASSRIKERIIKAGLTQEDIYPNDPKQISWIINNKRTKNNRFLITDAVLSSDNEYEPTGLLPKLSFRNKEEILWGTDEEITSYLFDLFKLLLDEVPKENNFCQIDTELFLCDYVPYAKYSTYWNILNSQSFFPAIAFGISEDIISENMYSARENAFRYLYSKCKNDFTTIFINFANNTNSFHKINKVFRQKFIDELFIPMLFPEYEPDTSSLGLRVKKLIESDLLLCAPLVWLKVQPENNYISDLISASSEYILALEKIQEDYCSEFEKTDN